MSRHFHFLRAEWPDVYEAAAKAADAVYPDPRTACFYARRALELAVSWAFKYDASLRLPYQDNLSALIHEPTFKTAAGEAIFNKARVINTLGNRAVHSHRPIQQVDALNAVRELFHVGFWLARTYARGTKPDAGAVFDAASLPKTAAVPKHAVDYLLKLRTDLRERDEKLSELLADKSALDEELKRLRAEVAEAKKASAAQPDTHDYSEAQTRDYFIDLLLKEAGWALDQPRDREYEVAGMPNVPGKGFVDYVLWADDGRPLAVVEAKRTRKSPQIGQQQAKLYADCLEKQFGQRPIIFFTNGYDHWLWDDVNYPPREVQGFLKKAELELMIQRRESRTPLADAPINPKIVERYYQARAIRRIAEAFERDHDRKALVVMATGAGKTRTVIALCDLLMRCNWAKRVLFLADRVALVNQAASAFRTHLPDASPVNLVTERDGEGRVFVSTYPTMMGLIDETRDGQRRFGVGHFDLVVVDEAHRSVYQKYRAIFSYFDALLVGLTATPKDEIDINTYGLFDLERGVPTDAYSLEEAVKDGFLVPPHAVSVPMKFPREGITYDELPDEEKERWDAIEWQEDGGVPDRVEPPAVNKWLFNEDTVDKVLEHLMTRGQTVAGGDRLGKTIIFAKNQAHAEFIAKRFDKNYPHHKGAFARMIHHEVTYAQNLIDDFSNPSRPPHIAISVDMLDTGIDIPEVVNLVFLKLVRSKTKFWQMVGRGTRLRKDLFGPGKDKAFFFILDFCENLEFFRHNPATTDGALAESLGKRLFKTRLELISELDRPPSAAPSGPANRVGRGEARVWHAAESGVAAGRGHDSSRRSRRDEPRQLRRPAAAPARREIYEARRVGRPYRGRVRRTGAQSGRAAVRAGPRGRRGEAVRSAASQPAARRAARGAGVPAAQRSGEAIAGLLEEKSSIPMVAEQLPLIQEIQSDEWWQDVTPLMLEHVRKRLRLLVKFIDKQKRKPIYTDFEDQIGDEAAVGLPGFEAPDSFERFRAKVRAFLKEHEDHVAIRKLRLNRPLGRTDLDDLERMLTSSGVAAAGDVEKAKAVSHGLGLFVRSLVGLDREAAKQAFARFLGDKTLNANQIEFINLIVDHLTDHGVMGAALLYESPFTDITPRGPDGLFTSPQLHELLAILDQVRSSALAA